MDKEVAKALGVYTSMDAIEEMDRKRQEQTGTFSPGERSPIGSIYQPGTRYHLKQNMGRSSNEKGRKD